MTFSRVAPGPQLGTGRLRVDAARAIAKLREYQLADRTAWILEAIRAAVASGASRIELRGDANDIWLAWDGTAWPPEDLPLLFDELVSPEPTGGRHHLRLLAAGVNSALGMNPAYVDVIAIGVAGAHRARYTPDVLDDTGDELGDSPLRRIAAEAIAAPTGARPGMLVHLRRRASLEVLSYLLRSPPELALARAACRDLGVPLVVEGEVLERANAGRDVLRIPLGEALDGFIAAIDPVDASEVVTDAVIEVAERGVVLERYALDLFGTGPRRTPIPIRVFVDAPRMPTNASRSQVRRDDYPIRAAEQQAIRLVHELVGRLAGAVAQPRARDAVIALLATEVAIGTAGWPNAIRDLRKPFRVLAALHLVRDAVGAPRPLASAWNGLVYTGAKPFEPELARWLSDVIWIRPGDPATALVQRELVDAGALRRRVRWARRQRNAHRRFYDHKPTAAKLAPRAKPRIRAPLGVAIEGSCVPQHLFDGLTGEVCLDLEPAGGELIVLLDGREIERARFESPVAFAVVIASKRLTPGDRYRAVVRDDRYAEVERAMRAGIVRAVEALFVVAARGVELGAESPATDLELARAALGIAGELRLGVRGPLAIVPLWLVDDTRRSLAELARSGVIGVVAATFLPHHVPAGRVIVKASDAERRLLSRLLPDRLVSYDLAHKPDRHQLVQHVLKLAPNALIVRDGDILGAIGPAPVSSLGLYHMGVHLETCDLVPGLVTCAIAVDAPQIVPDASWREVADDAGLTRRTYLDWKRELVRAAARAIAGDPPHELGGPGSYQLDGELGRVLCTAVLRTDPRELLGDALIAMLARAPIVPVYGALTPRSLAELAEGATELSYVSGDGPAIAGFTAIVAGELVASALAKLAGLVARDATPELDARRQAALFASRLASHRTQLTRPIAVPGITVPLESAMLRGVVGVGTGALSVEIFVEERPFTWVMPRPPLSGVVPSPELPLATAIELEPEQCGPTFDGLPHDVLAELARALRVAAPALLLAIAAAAPEQLATTGPARTLLAAWLARSEPASIEVHTLRNAAIFATVQGTRVSLEQARQPHGIVSIATWQEPWLADDNQAEEPILFVPEGESEIQAILESLHGGPMHDVTDQVRKLQSQRRMARGLLHRPRVRGIPPELVREVTTLGPLGLALGHGEIGLVSPAVGGPEIAELLIHDHGTLRERTWLDVMPPIQLAIEAPELVTVANDPLDLHARFRALGLSDVEPHALSADAQALAVELVRAVVREMPLLPPPIRRAVARAWLARRVPDLEGIPLFETMDGTMVDHAAIEAQLARFGTVWTVSQPPRDRPLDSERLVLHLAADDLELARAQRRQFVDASHELALDSLARTNRARPPATALAIPRDGVLATVELTGDGLTAPRGIVGVLAPGLAAHHRGLFAHRQMHPFDPSADPCRWPTIAAIDDARLGPDRTWANPDRRGTWFEIVAQVRDASERASSRMVEVPPDALVVDQIDARSLDGLPALRASRDTQLRGAVWLTDAPFVARSVVEVIGVTSQTIVRDDGLAGRVFAFTPDAIELGAVLAEVLDAAHARLLRALLDRGKDVDRQLLEAHVARGLATRHLLVRDARKLVFDCFAPRALDASQLAELFGGAGPVPAVTLASDADPRVITFVDDDTPLARVVRDQLGPRIRRAEPSPFAPPRSPVTKTEAQGHVLTGLVQVLDARLHDLGITGFRWEIVDRDDLLARFDTTIRIGGKNARLRALAAAHAANSPWAPAAIDAVAAHVVTILNVALTEITDATEAHALGVLLASSRSNEPWTPA